jgi:mono/diheme cytochrome c family protein
MKKIIEFRSLSTLTLSILAIITLLSMAKYQAYQNPQWISPARTDTIPQWISPTWADTIRNPLKGDNESTMGGKEIYTLKCVICHGEKGKGDGPLSSNLTTRPLDFGSISFQNQSDGAIFWKISNGKRPMPAFGGVLSIQQRWQVINYIRTLTR